MKDLDNRQRTNQPEPTCAQYGLWSDWGGNAFFFRKKRKGDPGMW